jgi:hypothetical protein
MNNSVLAPMSPIHRVARKVALVTVIGYGLLCAADVVALYTYYFQATAALGHWPAYDNPELPAHFIRRLHFLEDCLGVLIWGFPAHVVAHGWLLLTKNICNRASAWLVAVVLFLVFSSFMAPIGQWVYD